MRTCRFAFDSILVENHRSDSSHADNDWVTWLWFVDDVAQPSRRAPLTTDNGSTVLWDNDLIHDLVDQVDCDDAATVGLVWRITNVSIIRQEDQGSAVDTLGARLSQAVAPDYRDFVRDRLAYAADGPLAPVVGPYVAELEVVVDTAIGRAVGDAIDGLLHGLADLAGGQPDCDGLVASGAWIFPPRSNAVHSETVEQTQSGTGSACGAAPRTRLSWTAERHVTEVTSTAPGSPDATSPLHVDPRLGRDVGGLDAATTTAHPDSPELGRLHGPGEAGIVHGQPHPLGPGTPSNATTDEFAGALGERQADDRGVNGLQDVPGPPLPWLGRRGSGRSFSAGPGAATTGAGRRGWTRARRLPSRRSVVFGQRNLAVRRGHPDGEGEGRPSTACMS